MGTSNRLLKKLVVRSNFSMFPMAANGEMGGDPRCLFGIRYSTLQTDSLRCGQNLRDANEIVGGGGKDKKPLDQLPPAMTGLTQTADGLHPAERFLDPLALLHADGIARMARRARIDCRAAVCIVLCHMWHSATFAAPGDEIGGVVILVGADRAAGTGILVDHAEGGGAFGRSIGFSQPGVNNQPIPVFGHQMTHVTELGLLAGALAEQARIGIRCRRMRVIRALFTMKIALGIASTVGLPSRGRRAAAVLQNKALHGSPRLDQRAIDREMFTRQQLA